MTVPSLEPLESATLRDGTPVLVVPLQHEDREELREAYEHLSPESRFHRFLSAVPHLTETMLDHLVDDVDGVDHVALVLRVPQPDGTTKAVGIARILRYDDRPDAADVAVTVIDEWQGRGVASVLLDVLLRHRPAGVRQLVTEVAADNPASLAMLARLGSVTQSPAGAGRIDVVVDLPG